MFSISARIAIYSACMWIGGLSLFVERVPAAGVTLVTHGFNSDVDGWVIPMADRIPGHPGFKGTQFSCYRIDITESGGQLTATATLLGGPHGDLADSGEIFIKLDWSSEAGLLFGSSSTEVAAATVAAMTSPDLIPELDGHALAELPMHLIGHSRGASVVSEMARLFGAQGIWVDHLTMHDPVDNTFGDGAIAVWENILFADNYWQTIDFYPTGKVIAGAYNRKLTSLGGGYGAAHSDVHLWYHGTVELTTPATDTQETIGTSQRMNWWVAGESDGSTAGFHYSRIGGGDRLSSVQPLGAGTDRIVHGYNRMWDLGGGVSGNRTMLPANFGLWPNVIRCEIGDKNPVTAGTALEIEITHQSGASPAGNVATTTWLDVDGNAWNGNGIPLGSRILANTGKTAVATSGMSFEIESAAVLPGEYRVVTAISDGQRTRFLYAADTILVVPPPTIEEGSIGKNDGSFGFTVLGSPGQKVTIKASCDLKDWVAVDSRVLDPSGAWIFADQASDSFPRRFYILSP